MPKQPPKNGYYYYMQDFRAREERAGRRFYGMADVAAAASSGWRDLPQEERDRYNDFAKDDRPNQERRNVPKKLENKFDSQGVSFAEKERRRQKQEANERAITKFVQQFVAAKDIDGLKDDYMYLVHVNIFCKTDDHIYYPAELAIVKFSIKEGPIDKYHTFFDPGDIKKGYSFAVQDHSKKTHKLMPPSMCSGVCDNYNNYEQIYDEICKFLKLNENQSVPLFTMYDDVQFNTSLIAVEKTLASLWHTKHSAPVKDEAWRKYFPVYPLPLLFTEFKKTCYYRVGSEETGFANSSLAIIELNHDTYRYHDEFGCEYHQKEDAVWFCSQSYVLRWANIIRVHCAPILEVSLEADQNEDVSNYNTALAASVCDNDLDDEDDRFTECGSMVSGISCRTTRTDVTAASGFSTKSAKSYVTEQSLQLDCGDKSVRDHDAASVMSNVSQVSQPSSCWSIRGRGRGRVRPTAVPPMNNEDFPALGGVRRGMRSMNLNK